VSETNEFKITQTIDSGQVVQLSLTENVSTEPLSQKQMIMENLSKKLDAETRKQIMPVLYAILQAQPTIKVKSYRQTQVTIAMPKSRYQNIGSPGVGDILTLDFTKITPGTK